MFSQELRYPDNRESKKNRLKIYAAAVFGAISSSLAPVLTKRVLMETDPFTLAFLVSLIGTVIMILYISSGPGWNLGFMKNKKTLAGLLLIWFGFQAIPTVMMYTAQIRLPSTFGVLLKRTQPIMVLLLSALLLKQSLTFRKIAITLSGVLGVFFLVNAGFCFDFSPFLQLEIILMLSAILAWALLFTLYQKLASNVETVYVTLGTVMAISLVAFPFAFDHGGLTRLTRFSTTAWICMTLHGIFSSTLGLNCVLYSLKKLHPWVMSLIMLSGPLFGLVAAFFLLKETLNTAQLCGAGLIIFSLAFLAVTEKKYLNK